MVEPDDYTVQAVLKSGARVHSLPSGLSYAQEIQHYPEGAENIVVDLGHRKNLDNPHIFVEYLDALSVRNYQIAVMDGLDDDSFRDERAPKTKAYIQPYWGVAEHRPPNTQYWLYGAPYVLLDHVYKEAYRERSGGDIRNILVTFGGSDPQGNTSKVTKALCHEMFRDCHIRIIIGPSFSETHIEQIEALANDRGNMALIYAPRTLAEHYSRADLCIGGSSTSRYEAAACGLPMMFTAIYPEHIKLSETFADYGTAQYVGYADDLTDSDWQSAIFSLLQNTEDYIKMVNAITEMQPSRFGTDYLAEKLLNVFKISEDET